MMLLINQLHVNPSLSIGHILLLLQGFAPDMRHARPTVTRNIRNMTEDAT